MTNFIIFVELRRLRVGQIKGCKRSTNYVRWGAELLVGEHYCWDLQDEKMIYLGTKNYAGDPRTWYQFALTTEPDKVWSEVLEEQLQLINKINNF